MMRHVKLCVISLLLLAGSRSSALAQAPVQGYEVINSYPHDTSAFTEGLILQDGRLYESTGLYGASSLREVDLQTGTVVRKTDIAPQYFAEGMTIFQGKIFQLTWQSQTGFIYDPATFAELGQFFYPGEGWGLTHDDNHLIMSDGTNQIRFLDPTSFQTVKSISVYDSQGAPLTNINELELINGEIYANIWLTNWIVRIDPGSGAVRGWIDLTGLLPAGTTADVLNGIAYDAATGHLLVTGKWWPWLFEIQVHGGSAPVAYSQSPTTPEDAAVGITLTASDVGNTALTFTIVTGPAHGTLTGSAPNLTYSPATDYSGPDSFTFTANDGLRESNIATVSITVTPVNDAPVANPNAYTTSLNTALITAAPGVLGNDADVDGDSLAAVLASAPLHGAVTLSADGSFTYIPSTHYSGQDSFTYLASDGVLASNVTTVSISISGPIASLSTTSLSFGNQTLGTTSGNRTVTLTNTGTEPLTLSIAVTGTNAGDFAQSNSCGASVAPGAACTIEVTFRPTATGSRRGTIAITDNATGSPHLIALSGTGKKARGR